MIVSEIYTGSMLYNDYHAYDERSATRAYYDESARVANRLLAVFAHHHPKRWTFAEIDALFPLHQRRMIDEILLRLTSDHLIEIGFHDEGWSWSLTGREDGEA